VKVELSARRHPNARIAVDHFHLIVLGDKAVTAVGQRLTRDLLGRRGRKIGALCSTAARGGHPSEVRDRLHTFYQWCADARIPS
jgi:hypothetical protein